MCTQEWALWFMYKLYRHKLYRHNLHRHKLYRHKLYREQIVSGTNCYSYHLSAWGEELRTQTRCTFYLSPWLYSFCCYLRQRSTKNRYPKVAQLYVHIHHIYEILNKSNMFNKQSSGLHFVYPVCSTYFPGCKNILYVSD